MFLYYLLMYFLSFLANTKFNDLEFVWGLKSFIISFSLLCRSHAFYFEAEWVLVERDVDDVKGGKVACILRILPRSRIHKNQARISRRNNIRTKNCVVSCLKNVKRMNNCGMFIDVPASLILRSMRRHKLHVKTRKNSSREQREFSFESTYTRKYCHMKIHFMFS